MFQSNFSQIDSVPIQVICKIQLNIYFNLKCKIEDAGLDGEITLHVHG